MCMHYCEKISQEEYIQIMSDKYGCRRESALNNYNTFKKTILCAIRSHELGILRKKYLKKSCKYLGLNEDQIFRIYALYTLIGSLEGYDAELSRVRSLQIIKEIGG